MPEFYYAIGTTLANMANIETTYNMTANTLDAEGIALVPPSKERVASGSVVRNGKVNTALAFSTVSVVDFRAFVYGVFGNLTTNSASVFISAIDEFGYYSPFSVTIDRPYVDNYEVVNSGWRQRVIVPCFGWTLQSVTKSSNATTTTSERLVYGDTSSGNVTLTIPFASTVPPNTAYSFIKSAASNTLTLLRTGSNVINGSTTATLSANNERIDLISDGVNSWTSI